MKRFVLILPVAAFSISALADELPGVSQPKQIVQPLPESDNVPDTERQAVSVGDWDVRVSGSVIVDIGAGKRPR